MNSKTILVVASVVLCGVISTGAAAHYKFRIVGTVTKITADEIGVKQVKDNAIHPPNDSRRNGALRRPR